ncbi:MAG: sigma-54-dependent Fis family transcriptional regulator, partial [Planctomycetes bacterium]|nr:sigma-54-dependent Fis family transcriptional regulator [Planctomycetota bacterium]
ARTLWIVDDDPGYRDLLRDALAEVGRTLHCAASAEEALAAMDTNPADLILLDMRMPGMGGLGLLRTLNQRETMPAVLVLTAFAEVEDAVEAMKLGARDYLQKPVDLADLAGRVAHLLQDAPTDADGALDLELPDHVIAESPMVRDLLREWKRVAQSPASVLLTGESGTGKEVFARLLHDWSERKDAPFVPLNMASLPETLAESELFGHAKGAFTGADREREGWIEKAQGGTLFLDEIAELSPPVQAKLLRVLEEHELRRVGENRTRQVDFRLISATHQDLEASVAAGNFRADLYYRLAVVTFELPPLRERPEDILPLAKHFLSQASTSDKRLSTEAIRRLQEHPWPGNVRELKNAMARAAILSPGSTILPEHLPPSIAAGSGEPVGATDLLSVEKRTILDCLERNRGNRSHTARELGISRRKLLYRLKEYGVGREDRSIEKG